MRGCMIGVIPSRNDVKSIEKTLSYMEESRLLRESRKSKPSKSYMYMSTGPNSRMV